MCSRRHPPMFHQEGGMQAAGSQASPKKCWHLGPRLTFWKAHAHLRINLELEPLRPHSQKGWDKQRANHPEGSTQVWASLAPVPKRCRGEAGFCEICELGEAADRADELVWAPTGLKGPCPLPRVAPRGRGDQWVCRGCPLSRPKFFHNKPLFSGGLA